ncbi:MAG: fasciclin domain-containing protein [Chloroflexi bacterium]|nr:fasciclin domain-containing protein [Chloroflexota bacterium]
MRKFRTLIVLALVVLAAFTAVAQDAETPTIAEIVVASTTAETPEFTVLLAAVQAADPAVIELLSDPEASVTVFAPTDAAFAAAFEALGVTAADVLADPAALTAILLYHVVPGAYDAAYVTSFEEGTLLGTLLPGTALALNISEEGAFINEAGIVATDIAASNGIVHVIDGVLLPPAAEDEMDGEMMEMEEPTLSIAETVVAASEGDMPEFTVLLAAVVAADPSILDTLSNGGPFTVFAPTDAAFGALLEALGATAEDVLANTDLLNTVLAYHVVPGTFAAADVVGAAGEEGFSIATLLPGGALDVALVDGGVVINGSVNVVATDVYATNGVIHVIDAVLVPATEE